MRILITKKLSSKGLNILKSKGWYLDTIDLLKITPLEIEAIPNADVWIISSRNSWPLVKINILYSPPFIYCIGTWMENELKKNGCKASIKTFDSMISLSNALLTKLKNEHLLYFCGDPHRHELEQALEGLSITLTKVITHKSRLMYPIVKKLYDAVFVFSPRSAESLLMNNSFPSQTIFACLGTTTAAYLHARGITNTFCASHPASETLIKEFCNLDFKKRGGENKQL